MGEIEEILLPNFFVMNIKCRQMITVDCLPFSV